MNPARRQTWYALAVLFCLNALNFYDRQILGAVAEPVRKELGLSDTKIGLLGTAFTLLYAAVGVPFGRLADTWTRNRLLSLGVAAWSLLTAASGFVHGYWALFATRLGVGIGEASCAPAASSLIGDLFPAGQRARALSIFMLGLPNRTRLRLAQRVLSGRSARSAGGLARLAHSRAGSRGGRTFVRGRATPPRLPLRRRAQHPHHVVDHGVRRPA